MASIDLVIAEYKHLPQQYKVWTRQGFLCEMNHAYSKNMQSLKYAVDFCNRKMGKRFYTIVNGICDLKRAEESIEEGKRLTQALGVK